MVQQHHDQYDEGDDTHHVQCCSQYRHLNGLSSVYLRKKKSNTYSTFFCVYRNKLKTFNYKTFLVHNFSPSNQ